MEDLSKIALNIRRNIIKMIYAASSGHPGGALSCADLLTVLYFSEMNIDKDNLKDENRDRFVLSKGHASAALYWRKKISFRKKNYWDLETSIVFCKDIQI